MAATPTDLPAQYLLETGTDLSREQLECIGTLHDRHTIDMLATAGLRRGGRCLEIGAGNGGIARWMADRVRPGGHVLAVDIDTTRLVGGPGLEVRRHDIDEGVPDGGPFDLIHARMVLMHLPRRREIVTELIDALAPGGALVLGEYALSSFEPLAAPNRAAADLFDRVVRTTIDRIGRPGGICYEWAHEMDDYLVRAGLVDVHSERAIQTTAGAGTGCILYSNYIKQVAPRLHEIGISAGDLELFHALMLDPRFRAWQFEFNCVRAQKPM